MPDSIKTIGVNSFRNGESITSIRLSENAEFTTISAYAFQNCSNVNLNTLSIPTNIVTIGNYAFDNCSGVETLTEILRAVDRGTEQNIMDYLKKENSDVEEEIRKKLFTYEDIIKLDDKSIQRVLRDVDNHVLALAIKASTKNIQDLLFKNLSNRVADLIKEDIELMIR